MKYCRNLFSVQTALLVTIAASALSAPAIAQAEELRWKSFKAVGGGDGTPCRWLRDSPENNMEIVNNGSVASFLFSTVGILLSPSSPQLSSTMSCNIQSQVVIPRGYYVDTVTQTISAGVVKDAGTTGGISSNSFLFQDKIPLSQINLVFPANALNEPFMNKSNTQIFTKDQKRLQCLITAFTSLTTGFKFQVVAAGIRPSSNLTFITQIDGSDVQLDVTPSIKPCNGIF